MPHTKRPEQIRHIPAIHTFCKKYAVGSSSDDQRYANDYVQYETIESLNRLRNELISVKDGKVSEPVCMEIIGNSRKAKYEGFDKWARNMLLWLAKKR